MDNWITLSQLSGSSGTTTVTITAATNSELIGRTTSFTVRTIRGGLSSGVTVNQEPRDVVTVEVSPTGLTAPSSGVIDTITITSNGDWTITAPDWMVLSTTTGTGNATITVTVRPNDTYADRTGSITVSTIDNSASVSVVQERKDGGLITTPLTLEILSSDLIYIINTGTNKDIRYSMDSGATWTAVGSGKTWITVSEGDVIQFIGDNNTVPYLFKGSQARFKAYGNIMSVIDSVGYGTATTLTTNNNHAFEYFFYQCPRLTDASNLILPTTLSEYCYYSMFGDCTSLSAAPSLPSTTLYECCYGWMFSGCRSLTIPPNLPATTLAQACYGWMFSGCTGLTTAPELPSTTLAGGCYAYMFQGCTSLTTAPALPATTLTSGCYRYMFQGCTSLTTAPELPATALTTYCYNFMFSGCTSLTTAPELPATTMAENCYNSMFLECTSLTQAPYLPATTMADFCYRQMFKGCTSLTQAPSILPATDLSNVDGCYDLMFMYCSGLTSAPELPAESPIYCYQYMFSGCTNLNYIKCLSLTGGGADWVAGVSPTGTFVKTAGSYWSIDVNGIPNGWTVVDA